MRSDTASVTITVAEGQTEEFPIDFGDGILRRVAVSQARCDRGGNARRVTVRPIVGGEVVGVMKRDQGRA